MKPLLSCVILLVIFIAAAFQAVQAQQTSSASINRAQNTEGEPVEWPAYGRDLYGSRYLPASKINRKNIQQLDIAWTYRTGEAEPEYATERPASFQTTPVMVDGTLYFSNGLLLLTRQLERSFGSSIRILTVIFNMEILPIAGLPSGWISQHRKTICADAEFSWVRHSRN